MIERTPRILLVRRPAQQLRARRIHRRDEDQREILGLSCLQSRCAVLSNESGVGQCGARCEHLRAADDRASIRLANHMQKDVTNLMHRLVAIHGRIDEHVIQKQGLRCEAPIPLPGILFEWSVKLGVRSKCCHERCFVIRSAAHESVCQARPHGNRITRSEQFAGRVARGKETMRANAESIDSGQRFARLGPVQGIVQAGNRSRGITEPRIGRDVFDALAVEIHVTRVPQACQVFGTRHEFVDNRALLG